MIPRSIDIDHLVIEISVTSIRKLRELSKVVTVCQSQHPFCLRAAVSVFLIRSRSRVHTRRFRKVRHYVLTPVTFLLTDNQVLSELISMTWESAIPPSTCAIAAFAVCMHSVRVLPPSMTDLSHKHAEGTPCLLLDRHVTNHPWKIIRHFAVRDPVRPSPNIFCVLPTYQFAVIAHILGRLVRI